MHSLQEHMSQMEQIVIAQNVGYFWAFGWRGLQGEMVHDELGFCSNPRLSCIDG